MLKHEIRITLRLEGIATEDNECMSMECKAFVQLDVQGIQQQRFQEGREQGEVVNEMSSTITFTTFRRAVPQNVFVLTERVKRNSLFQILWAISARDVASVERRHRSFAEMPMSWFAASSKSMTPYNFLVTSCRSSFSI